MDYIFTCCHCNEVFIISKNDFNCMILRHGVYKSNNTNINPHLPKNECDMLYNNNMIYGCGKPLYIINKDKEYDVIKCDYI